MKTRLLFGMAAAMATLLTTSASAGIVLFDGSSVSKIFGTGSVSQDALEGSPNSDVAQSALVNLTNAGSWQNIAINSTVTVAPADIDWSAGDLQFDYKVNGGTQGGFYQAGLYASNGSGNVQLAIYSNVTTLTIDGEWHTFTASVSDWTTAYYDAVSASTIDPNAPIDLYFYYQTNGSGADLNIDNITVPSSAIPEPSHFAIAAGLIGLCFVGLRRFRRDRAA